MRLYSDKDMVWEERGEQMKIGINQFCFPGCMDVEESLQCAKDMGYDTFEVCLTVGKGYSNTSFGVTDVLDISGYYNELCNINSTEHDFMTLKKKADETGMKISSVGGIVSFSIFPLSSPDEKIAQKSMDAVKKMVDAARILEADTVLVIPGMITEDMEYIETYERVRQRVADIAEYAGNINIALENVWNYFLYSPMEFRRFVDEIGRKNVGIYFDIANARRFGYPEQWIRTFSHRIRGIHVKDYRMSVDNIHGFTNILDGDVDYRKVMEALTEVKYDGPLTVELIPPAHDFVDQTLMHARRVCEMLVNRTKQQKEL